MIKKLISAIVASWLGISSAMAAEEEIFVSLYTQVPAQSVENITAEDVAVVVLKGISALDNALRVADDDKRISLYYRGNLISALSKPQDENNAQAWAGLSGKLLDKALQTSKKVRAQDFEAIDKMLAASVQNLAPDSKYYASLNDWKADKPRHQRYFGSRREGDLLYLKIVAFNKHSKAEIEKAVAEFADLRGVIIDLRGSPGGMLGEAIKIADLFLDEAIVISTKGREPDSQTYYQAKDGDIINGKPIVVLIDGETASAAEVLAVVLQEQGRAKVIGTRSFGKGSIQNLIQLPAGGVLSLTSAYFYTPSGHKLHGQGVIPDICTFEMPESKDIDNLISIGKVEDCYSESRENSDLELKTARKLLEM